jgi:hypothetical protein
MKRGKWEDSKYFYQWMDGWINGIRKKGTRDLVVKTRE